MNTGVINKASITNTYSSNTSTSGENVFGRLVGTDLVATVLSTDTNPVNVKMDKDSPVAQASYPGDGNGNFLDTCHDDPNGTGILSGLNGNGKIAFVPHNLSSPLVPQDGDYSDITSATLAYSGITRNASIDATDAIHKTGGTPFTDAQLRQLTNQAASDQLGTAIPSGQINMDSAQMSAINDAKVAALLGNFPLTYTYTEANGTIISKAVTVSLREGGTDILTVTPGAPNIGANNAVSGTGGIPFTEAAIKDLNKVVAKGGDGTNIPYTNIDVNLSDLAALNQAKTTGQVGKFPITYTYDDGSGNQATVTVTVSLRDSGTDGALASLNMPSIGANNAVSKTGGNPFSENQIKDLTHLITKDKDDNPIGYNHVTVNPLEFVVINTAKISGKTGNFPLTYTYDDGSGNVITANVTISLRGQGVDGNSFNPSNPAVKIGANDTVSKTGGNPFTDSQIKGLTQLGVKDSTGAWVNNGDVSIDQSQFDALNDAKTTGETGDFKITYTYTDSITGETVSVEVTVSLRGNGSDGTVFDSKNPVAQVGGNDFTHYDKDGTLTIDQILDTAKVIVYDKDGNLIPNSNLTVNQNQFDAINNAIKANKSGDYKLTIYAPDGTAFTITITLIGEPVIGTAGNVTLINKLMAGDSGAPLSLLLLLIISGGISGICIRRKKLNS